MVITGIDVAMAVCCGVAKASWGVAMADCGWASFPSDSMLLATTYGANTCGFATVIVSCGCGAGICAEMVIH